MKKCLTIEDRMLIEQLLKLNYKLKNISSILDCKSSTISREINRKFLSYKEKNLIIGSLFTKFKLVYSIF